MAALAHRSGTRRLQRGLSLVMVTIVLGVFALALIGLARMRLHDASERAGQTAGAALNMVSAAVNQYRTTNLGTLTMSLTPAVPGFADAMAPTTAELKAAGFLSTNVADTLGDAGAYNIVLEREPAGCLAPAVTCSVWSRIHMSNPLVDLGTGRPDITRLSALIARVEESTSFSMLPDPTVITGGNGTWTVPNPDPARRAGILIVVAGLGGASEPWLRVQDTRNPNFVGPTVTGTQFNTPQVNIGAACTQEGAFGTGDKGVAFCFGGTWVSYGAEMATPLTACTTEGVLGQTPTGQSLICVGAMWRDNLTYGYRGTAYYSHNQTVPRPVCGQGLAPQAVVGGASASVIIGANNPGNNSGSWQATIDPNTWVVQIIGSDGSQAGSTSQVQVTTFCAVV